MNRVSHGYYYRIRYCTVIVLFLVRKQSYVLLYNACTTHEPYGTTHSIILERKEGIKDFQLVQYGTEVCEPIAY